MCVLSLRLTVQQTSLAQAKNESTFTRFSIVVVSSGVHFKKMKEEVNLLSFRFPSANKMV